MPLLTNRRFLHDGRLEKLIGPREAALAVRPAESGTLKSKN
jgi:hypothetical protein